MTDDHTPDDDTETDEMPLSLPRRGVLGLLGLGGLGILSSPVGAQPPGGRRGGGIYNWRQDVDANGQALEKLGSLGMAGGEPISSLVGRNLSIDDGVLNAAMRADVSDETAADTAGVVVEEATNIIAGAGLIASKNPDTEDEAIVAVEQGPDSGLDADTLDGKHATDFVLKKNESSTQKSAVSVGLSAQQTIAKNDSVVVAFDDVDVDGKDEFDTTSHEFTAREAGTYHVDVYVTVASLGARSDLKLRLEKSTETATETVAYAEVGTENQVTMTVSRLLQLDDNEVLKVRFTNGNTTEDRALVDFGQNASMFSVYQVS